MFKVNESPNDRRTRGIIGGVVLLVACFVLSGWIKLVASIIGIILIFTAITGYCALYRVFKISTKKEDMKEENKEKQ